MVLVESGCLMSDVLELRPASPAALMLVLVCTPVHMTKMLELVAPFVHFKEPSDFVEALFQTQVMDVWRSATTTSGAQCAITYGVLQMLLWSVDSWGSAIIQVSVVG